MSKADKTADVLWLPGEEKPAPGSYTHEGDGVYRLLGTPEQEAARKPKPKKGKKAKG